MVIGLGVGWRLGWGDVKAPTVHPGGQGVRDVGAAIIDLEERGATMSPRRSNERAEGPRAYRELSDAALMEAMRRDDSKAIDEFILRYEPFLRERGRRAGLHPADADEVLIEVLEDIGAQIASGRFRPSGSLASYLFMAFRNRCLRHARVQSERDIALVSEPAPTAAAYSEGSIRASRGPAWEEPRLSPALERLARRLAGELDDIETRMLVWLSHYVPQREIAEWLGLSYAAATQRIWRLRERLRTAAMRYADDVDSRERRELERFFRRVGHTGRTRNQSRRGGDRAAQRDAGDPAGRAWEEQDDD